MGTFIVHLMAISNPHVGGYWPALLFILIDLASVYPALCATALLGNRWARFTTPVQLRAADLSDFRTAFRASAWKRGLACSRCQ